MELSVQPRTMAALPTD